ncbi:queuine tRNA-ribosyltransferase accessory subunit 2 isoform X2 [Zootermopsis nevadensis]|uniref:queuine tRNA-ribosyltransferase accessory subunit 2 isoform X2 n=1 Tax=Zootermopsis nevadensis TaxID=136037 RepID=UPI000B8EA85F|nr:queuine tRNA-ribosyltransferase accessory subunit 2 isoform X2 [Zootermopsis nevadensis]
MKFILSSVASCSNRIGYIKDIERLPGLMLETPMLLLYAKEYFTFCSIHDPAVATPYGFNDKNTISIWPRNGRKQLDPDKYMDMIEAFQPDMYQALCDGDTDLKSSKKRIHKSIDKSLMFFEKCLERHEKSEVLKKSAILGVVEGGYSIEGREKSAKYLADFPVFGYVIDGLHKNGPDVENLTFEDVREILEESLKHLPNEKFRILHGCWNPGTVLSMVELGIDAFDSSYPYTVTERGGALIFQNCINNLNIPSSATDALNAAEPVTDIELKPETSISAQSSSEPPEKKKISTQEASHAEEDKYVVSKTQGHTTESQSSRLNKIYELSLLDEKYAEDFTPLSRSCSCLTCQKHTRAYIHHLLQTHELLGPVLLTIHNLHHYMEFFKSIREAIKSNSLESLKRCVNERNDVS